VNAVCKHHLIHTHNTLTLPETRLLEPLRRLASTRARRQRVSAAHTLLPPLESNAFSALYHFTRRCSICLAIFSMVAITTEVITILVPHLSMSGNRLLYVPSNGTTYILPSTCNGVFLDYGLTSQFSLDFYLVLAVGIFFIVLVCYRLSAPQIPHGYSVRTVADTLRLVCGSQCVRQFAEVSMTDERRKKRIVLGWERKYAFGVVRGIDGVNRWGIDDASLVLRRVRTGNLFYRLFHRDKLEDFIDNGQLSSGELENLRR